MSMRNEFGKCLEQYMIRANIKNSTIARALNYDVSYISKWITGKAVPSKKNAEYIIDVICQVFIDKSDEGDKSCLKKAFGVSDDKQLKSAMIAALRNAYYQTTGADSEENYINNASLNVMPKGQINLFKDESLREEAGIRCAVVMGDLFAMDYTSKLHLAGIEDRHFIFNKPEKNIRLNYIVNMNSFDGESVYDLILLIHMMTSFSMIDFNLYCSDMASGKLIAAVKDEYAQVVILGESNNYLCSTVTKEKKTVNELYNTIGNYINPDKAVFFNTSMEDMLLKHKYLQNMMSADIKWLLGHYTEHIISPQLFGRLSKEYLDEDLRSEVERVYKFTKNSIEKNLVRIMIYNSALIDFALTGELDFFNHKVILSSEERQQELIYLKAMIGGMKSENVKFINEGFSDDFKYITNPCMFLSGTADYLRLENKLYKDNLLMIKEQQIQNAFNAFYEKIWSNYENVVIEGSDFIIQTVDRLINTLEILAVDDE